MSASVRELAAELAKSGRQVYVDGAVAHLVEGGMPATEARAAVSDAIRGGILRQRGTMLQATEAPPSKLVRRTGKRWVVAKKNKDGTYSTKDTRKGKRGEKTADTLKDLIEAGAKTYSTKSRAEVGAAQTYHDVPVRVAAELPPAKLVRRTGDKYVVAHRTSDGMYVSKDTRKGEGELAIGDTLKELISGGARSYRSRQKALAAAAKAYHDVPVRVAAEGSCSVDAIMAEERLSKSEREALPDSAFAYVNKKTGERLFPVHDARHAVSAMGLLHTWYPRGRFTDAEYESIRRNILKAYKKFGLTAHAPSMAPGTEGAPMARRLGVAAETSDKERTDMALTKQQRREIAMRNLQKAWAKQGRGGKPGKKAKPMSAMETAAQKKQREQYARMAKAWGAQGRDLTPLIEKAKKEGVEIPNGKTKAKPKPIKARSTSRSTPAKAKTGKPATRSTRSTRSTSTSNSKGKSKRKQKVTTGKYISPQSGQMISIRRVYPRKNPWVEFSWETSAAAGAGIVGGLMLSAGADRFLATMAPKGSENPKYGMTAARAIHARPDALRMGVQFVGMALFGVGAYMGRSYPAVMMGTGAAAMVFGVKFLSQLGAGVIAPLLVKADKATEQSWKTRMFPDLQDWAQPGTTAAINGGNGNAGTAGAMPRGYSRRMSFNAANLPPAPPSLPVARAGVGDARSEAASENVGVGGCAVCASDVSMSDKQFSNYCPDGESKGRGVEPLPDGQTPEDDGDGFVMPPLSRRQPPTMEVQPAEPTQPLQPVPGTDRDGGDQRDVPPRLADIIRLAARRPEVQRRDDPRSWNLRLVQPQQEAVR